MGDVIDFHSQLGLKQKPKPKGRGKDKPPTTTKSGLSDAATKKIEEDRKMARLAASQYEWNLTQGLKRSEPLRRWFKLLDRYMDKANLIDLGILDVDFTATVTKYQLHLEPEDIRRFAFTEFCYLVAYVQKREGFPPFDDPLPPSMGGIVVDRDLIKTQLYLT